MVKLRSLNVQWVDKAKILLKDMYSIKTSQANLYVKEFEFLIHYAEKLGTNNLEQIIESIENFTDPCTVIEKLFEIREDN